MLFWAKRTANVLSPDGDESIVELSKLPFGKPLRVEVKQPRSGPQHRLYWALCQRIGNAVGADPENISDLIKIETGHCEVVKSAKYGEIRLPRSIAYANMDQISFQDFVSKAIDVICNNWGMQRKDVLDACADILTPTDIR